MLRWVRHSKNAPLIGSRFPLNLRFRQGFKLLLDRLANLLQLQKEFLSGGGRIHEQG